jgi:peptide deformylase
MSIEIVQPHRVISRKVTVEDMPRVLELASEMKRWMKYKGGCVGLAHAQFDDKDPLAFFVTENEIVINPEITATSDKMIPSREGCMTFPKKDRIMHDRHLSIIVEHNKFKNGRLHRNSKTVFGFDAVIYQHEIDHINGVYCYDVEEK